MLRPKLHVIDGERPSHSDEVLMRLLRAGEKRALEELAARHLHAVASFCGRYLGDVASGEEIAQEVFLSLWARRSRYLERQKFREYLYTLAVNRCRNRDRWWRRLLSHRAELAAVRPTRQPDTLDAM